MLHMKRKFSDGNPDVTIPIMEGSVLLLDISTALIQPGRRRMFLCTIIKGFNPAFCLKINANSLIKGE